MEWYLGTFILLLYVVLSIPIHTFFPLTLFVLVFNAALSHWCIFHQDKAELVVTTWGKQFHSSEMTKKVPLLYLANDILQNSKRKGNEFVIEFWKVLPAALKEIVGTGDEHGKNVVSRLVCFLPFCFWTFGPNTLAYVGTGPQHKRQNFSLLLLLFFSVWSTCCSEIIEIVWLSVSVKKKEDIVFDTLA